MDNSEEFDPITFSLFRNALNVLEQEGMVEVVGIGDDGEEVYQITEKGMEYYMSTQMDFDVWMKIGYDAGWCSPPVCFTHDGVPMTASEDEEMTEGNDPCVHIMRFYESPDQKKGCEANHPPSVWRATNQDW
jgi:hypothetical protein